MTRSKIALALLGVAGVLLPALMAATGDDPVPPPPHTGGLEAAARFLVQHECPDGAPALTPCPGARPARAGALAFRRIDWSGVQISDAVLAQHLGQAIVAQSFDFGDAPRAFGRRDTGDGGDAIRVGAHGVGIYLTEDPGGGRQWLQGPDCPAGAGWLLWRGEPSPDWTETVVRLGITRAETACPPGWSSSATRWRLANLGYAWRDSAGGSGEVARATIITEHYGGADRAAADHMERFYHAELLGKVRWERWEQRGRSRMEGIDRLVAITADRCPGQPEPAPGPAWVRVDCRQWTVFDRAGGASLDWP